MCGEIRLGVIERLPEFANCQEQMGQGIIGIPPEVRLVEGFDLRHKAHFQQEDSAFPW